MIVRCQNCQAQYDGDMFDKCPACQCSQTMSKTENIKSIGKPTNTFTPSHDYSSIASGLKIFALIIFLISLLVAIISWVNASNDYSTWSTIKYVSGFIYVISGAISGLITLFLSWIFDGISDILKK